MTEKFKELRQILQTLNDHHHLVGDGHGFKIRRAYTGDSKSHRYLIRFLIDYKEYFRTEVFEYMRGDADSILINFNLELLVDTFYRMSLFFASNGYDSTKSALAQVSRLPKTLQKRGKVLNAHEYLVMEKRSHDLRKIIAYQERGRNYTWKMKIFYNPDNDKDIAFGLHESRIYSEPAYRDFDGYFGFLTWENELYLTANMQKFLEGENRLPRLNKWLEVIRKNHDS